MKIKKFFYIYIENANNSAYENIHFKLVFLSFYLRGGGHLMPHSTIFHLYRGSQFYWWRKKGYLEYPTDLPQVTDKLYHM